MGENPGFLGRDKDFDELLDAGGIGGSLAIFPMHVIFFYSLNLKGGRWAKWHYFRL